MSVLAWTMIALSVLNVYLVLRSAASGGGGPHMKGWVIMTHILGLVAQVALCGRVLTWW